MLKITVKGGAQAKAEGAAEGTRRDAPRDLKLLKCRMLGIKRPGDSELDLLGAFAQSVLGKSGQLGASEIHLREVLAM